MNVIDASALSKFILKEGGWEIVADYLTNTLSVDHVLKEVSNAVWKAFRRGFINAEDSMKKFSALLSLLHTNLELADETELLPSAFEMALKRNITVYDALYVELARRRGLPLVTCDELQAKVARDEGVEVILL
ncbi:MAG: type II toxin-antitoxin system VapC family toxin [Candidatus Korarchaeota archaeon]|nr:type II toxin-antitoxin system VapC family toxin [Candidatus Korarchaeota archaeon]